MRRSFAIIAAALICTGLSAKASVPEKCQHPQPEEARTGELEIYSSIQSLFSSAEAANMALVKTNILLAIPKLIPVLNKSCLDAFRTYLEENILQADGKVQLTYTTFGYLEVYSELPQVRWTMPAMAEFYARLFRIEPENLIEPDEFDDISAAEGPVVLPSPDDFPEALSFNLKKSVGLVRNVPSFKNFLVEEAINSPSMAIKRAILPLLSAIMDNTFGNDDPLSPLAYNSVLEEVDKALRSEGEDLYDYLFLIDGLKVLAKHQDLDAEANRFASLLDEIIEKEALFPGTEVYQGPEETLRLAQQLKHGPITEALFN